MAIIYFEGMDKVGKTTIAYELSKRILIPYFKDEYQNKLFSHDSSISLKYTELAFCELVIQTELDFIKDRGFLSEFVYSRALGRDTYYSLLKTFMKKMEESNSIIVYLTRTKHLEKDDIITPEQSLLVEHWYRIYNMFFNNRILNINVDDYIDEKVDGGYVINVHCIVSHIICELDKRGII